MPRSANIFTEIVDKSHPKLYWVLPPYFVYFVHTFENYLQMWPAGLTGGPGLSAQRPVGEEGQTDTGRAQAAQGVREIRVRQNGATPIHAQVSLKPSQNRLSRVTIFHLNLFEQLSVTWSVFCWFVG